MICGQCSAYSRACYIFAGVSTALSAAIMIVPNRFCGIAPILRESSMCNQERPKQKQAGRVIEPLHMAVSLSGAAGTRAMKALRRPAVRITERTNAVTGPIHSARIGHAAECVCARARARTCVRA